MEKERRKKSLNSQSCSKYPAPSGNERLLPPPAANPGTFVVGVYFPTIPGTGGKEGKKKKKAGTRRSSKTHLPEAGGGRNLKTLPARPGHTMVRGGRCPPLLKSGAAGIFKKEVIPTDAIGEHGFPELLAQGSHIVVLAYGGPPPPPPSGLIPSRI